MDAQTKGLATLEGIARCGSGRWERGSGETNAWPGAANRVHSTRPVATGRATTDTLGTAGATDARRMALACDGACGGASGASGVGGVGGAGENFGQSGFDSAVGSAANSGVSPGRGTGGESGVNMGVDSGVDSCVNTGFVIGTAGPAGEVGFWGRFDLTGAVELWGDFRGVAGGLGCLGALGLTGVETASGSGSIFGSAVVVRPRNQPRTKVTCW